MPEKLKERPRQGPASKRAVHPHVPTKPPPSPPPRDCAEAPASNPNGEPGKAEKPG